MKENKNKHFRTNSASRAANVVTVRVTPITRDMLSELSAQTGLKMYKLAEIAVNNLYQSEIKNKKT